ncbi:MAG TPA: DPP IV N-terminal domain-containing protein, partial [Thermomicrobiaceae bacterium]|nr:DPP IV N-terminal domain-containing protein [Thermomicrobiaceae bacterium]
MPMTDTASRERAELPPVTTADYMRAESYLSWNVKPLIFNERVTPHWIGDGSRFWYRRASRQGSEFILVDPDAGTREPAFDHVRLAAELSKTARTPYTGDQLPFEAIDFNETGDAITFAIGDSRWSCDLETYSCRRVEDEPDQPKPEEVRSPDGRWDLFSREGNLFVREVASGREHQLTNDAEEYFDYGTQPDGRQSAVTDRAIGRRLTPSVRWSPDSTRVLTYRLDQRRIKPLHLLQAVPESGSWRPRLHGYRYALPGDEEVGEAAPVIIEVPSGEQRWLEVEPLIGVLHSPLDLNLVWWSDDGERVSIVHGSRDRQHVRLISVDARAGKARTILEESSRSWVYPQHVPMETPVTCVREVEAGGRRMFVWLSGRTGWMHLYLVAGDRDPSNGND